MHTCLSFCYPQEHAWNRARIALWEGLLPPLSLASSTWQHASDKHKIYTWQFKGCYPHTFAQVLLLLSLVLVLKRLLKYLEGTWCSWPCSAWIVKAFHVVSCLLHSCRCFSCLRGSLSCPPDNVLMLLTEVVLMVRTQHRTRRHLNFATIGAESWNCKTSLGIQSWNEATPSLKKAQASRTFKFYTMHRKNQH